MRASFRTGPRVEREKVPVEPAFDEAIELLHLEISELRRIVVNQGDAADQTAELLDRSLSLISAELSQLSDRVDRLALEHSRSHPS